MAADDRSARRSRRILSRTPGGGSSARHLAPRVLVGSPEKRRAASARSTRSAQRRTPMLTSRLTGDRLTPTDAAA